MPDRRRPAACLRRVLVAALVATGFVAPGCRPSSQPRPVLLVTVDALRRDRVGVYGPTVLPTPNMDRLGREGAVVLDAVAPFGRTTQGIGAILTGIHPLGLGADGLGMTLPAQAVTLAEHLRGRGYRTAAFTSNVFLRPGLGFEQGFELYSNPRPRWEGDSAAALSAEALAWIAEREKAHEPWFLWVHYLDPHWTYDPPAEDVARLPPAASAEAAAAAAQAARGFPPAGALIFEAGRRLPPGGPERIAALYDAEVAATDRALGSLLDGLAAQGALDRAITVLTSDHGESLGEHGYWFAHGEYIYEPSLAVPLLVRAPGLVAAGTRVTGVVGTEAVTPTILDLAGVPLPTGLDGASLATALRGASGTIAAPRVQTVHLADHVLVHPENPRRPVPGREGRWWALRDGRLKLLRIPQAGGGHTLELYDLDADPGETRDLSARDPGTVARMSAALDERRRALLARFQDAAGSDPVPAELETLRSLGYAH